MVTATDNIELSLPTSDTHWQGYLWMSLSV